jgi:hypothetical protein
VAALVVGWLIDTLGQLTKSHSERFRLDPADCDLIAHGDYDRVVPVRFDHAFDDLRGSVVPARTDQGQCPSVGLGLSR